ncbi:MAG: glycosyltransferase family 2 protein [Thermomicrobiales bacterium]
MVNQEPQQETDKTSREHEAASATHGLPFLSVVVPAYNEQERLPATIASIAEFLESQRYSWEVIVVDDGSEDDTVEVFKNATRGMTGFRILEQPHLGKAATVRTGVAEARGDNILFTDADLSAPISAVDDLLQARALGADVAIGSREGLNSRRIKEPPYRHLMGRMFNWLVRFVAVRGIKDTQCGFKLFSRGSAEYVFPRLLIHQSDTPLSGPRVSAFDVELLFIARKGGFRVVEIPVIWTHVPGSKVRPGVDAIRMFLDVLAVRWNAIRGKYN